MLLIGVKHLPHAGLAALADDDQRRVPVDFAIEKLFEFFFLYRDGGAGTDAKLAGDSGRLRIELAPLQLVPRYVAADRSLGN